MTAVNSVASNNALPLPSAYAGLDTLTLEQFQALSGVNQQYVIYFNHAGNPPQQVLGPAGSPQGLATLNADGITVTTEALPSGFTLAPANIDYATFSSWSQNVQAAYMLANSAEASSDDTTLSLTCGSGGATFTAMRPVPPRLFDESDPTTIQAPDVSVFDNLSFTHFQTLSNTLQAEAIKLDHAGNPPQLVIGPAGSPQGLATLNADGTATTETLPSGFTSAPANLDYATFSSWSQNVQAAYMLANSANTTSDGTTQTLVCGSGTAQFTASRPITATLYSASDPTTIQAPEVSVFTAFGLSHFADLITTGYTKADIPYENLGAAGGQYTVGTTAKTVAGVAATVYTAASSTQPPSSASPSSLSPQTFEAWTTEQQRAYITAQGGTGPITIGSSSGTIDVFVGYGNTAASPAPVYIAQNLQKTDIAKMSFKDQQTLTAAAGYPALAAAYGLMPNTTMPSTGTTSALATIQALIKSYRDGVTNPPNPPGPPPPYVQSLFTAQIDLISAQLFGTALPSAPAAGASDYTSNLTAPTLPSSTAAQTGGSAIFSETDIQAQLDAIQTRFKRVAAFAAQATLYNKPQLLSFDYVDSSTGQTKHYDYNSTDETQTLYKAVYNNGTHYSPVNIYGGTMVTTDYDPSTFLDFYKAAYHVSDQGFGADAAGVHPYGQFSLPNAPDMTGHTITLNGQPVSVGKISNIVVQNPTLSYAGSNGQPPLPTSVDNDVTIRSGYEKFVTQEAAIMSSKMLAANLAQSGTVAGSGQSLDMPKLLCLYMMYNYNVQQAVVTADSEEINQVNAVLQEYSAMQQVVNATTGISTSDANASLPMQFTGTNIEVLRMFNGQYGTSPVESLYFNSSAWLRPAKNGAYYLGPNQNVTSDTANNWTQFGTRLSDVVTQINQQSQIKMNDVNSETKQQDRYLDLASTALSKLSDTLSQIASAT